MAETLRQVVTDALLRDVRDPRVGFVTVTSVQVTNDLSHATVMVSVPGDEETRIVRWRGFGAPPAFFGRARPRP